QHQYERSEHHSCYARPVRSVTSAALVDARAAHGLAAAGAAHRPHLHPLLLAHVHACAQVAGLAADLRALARHPHLGRLEVVTQANREGALLAAALRGLAGGREREAGVGDRDRSHAARRAVDLAAADDLQVVAAARAHARGDALEWAGDGV